MNDAVRSSIFQGHFGKSGNVPPPSDPITITTMLVEIERIGFYEKNPRRTHNERYDEIKESIRHQGLDNPLPISRRPGATHYIIYKGGNTRLKVLKELWAETKDERFHKVRCEFHPFESDTDALLAHLRENDLRGNMTFIDKALAIREAKTQLEQETGGDLSLRKLAEALKARGFPVSAGMLSKLEYALSLHGLIPQVLAAGAGKDQMEKLRKLEKAAFEVWKFHALPDSSLSDDEGKTFRDVVFADALAATDNLGEEWRYEAVETAVIQQLGHALADEAPTAKIQANLKLALEGHELKHSPPPTLPVSAPVVTPPATNQPDTSAANNWSGGWGQGNSEQATDNISIHFMESDDSLPYPTTLPEPQREVIVPDGNWLTKLRTLRERNWENARLLARYVRNGEKSLTQLEVGFGFLMVDVFDTDWVYDLFLKTEHGDMDAALVLGHGHSLWWFLCQQSASFSSTTGTTGCPDTIRIRYLPEQSVIDDPQMRLSVHPLMDPMNGHWLFWHYLPDNHFDKAVEIIRNTRQIHDLILTHGKGATVWEVSTA
ncbi:ParB family protein [Thiothrix winogradskyi]|uniref:ParB N-terminal domain-containing protein n=1 Tax=Thiothrix winogradskyi TaxID=96472 RepID=A0ABY3T5F0_9GAMM|nr:ParB family protein [Thiothrix winogradskyi]UJS26442.1 ParB N-terminal domain-containing protein [Thiothrix winogradskyi]